jgi:hypothetical protein
MNLGKLLGAGKSFVNGGKAAAYRANKRACLPKFISPKNPFTQTVGEGGKCRHHPQKKSPRRFWQKHRKMPEISATSKILGVVDEQA